LETRGEFEKKFAIQVNALLEWRNARKRLREFELHKSSALESAEVVARGGPSRSARKGHVEAAAKSLSQMQRVVTRRHLPEEIRASLGAAADAAAARVTKLLTV
jgi:hypothetical protein